MGWGRSHALPAIATSFVATDLPRLACRPRVRRVSRPFNTTFGQPAFADRLNEALGSTTSESFARRIDRTLRTVQRWRSGESEPRGVDLVLLANALGRDPAWFYPDVDPPSDEAAA